MLDIREGAGSAKGLTAEKEDFIVLISGLPWEYCKDLIGGEPIDVISVETLEEALLDRQLNELPVCKHIVGMGTSMALEAAKYFALKHDLDLISIPLSLDSDAFINPDIKIWRDNRPHTLGQKSPGCLVLDYEAMQIIPEEVHISGMGHLLSTHTASFDWQHAKKQGKSRDHFSHKALDDVKKMLERLSMYAGEIRQCAESGLAALTQAHIELAAICEDKDNDRIRIGSEHYVKWELEQRLQTQLPAGNALGLGIYLMSHLQQNNPNEIVAMMNEVGLDYQPISMGISFGELSGSLQDLRYFVDRKANLYYTCINDAHIDEEWVYEICQGLAF